jgi:hypothetical protein
MFPTGRFVLASCLAALGLTSPSLDSEYDVRRAADVSKCQAIDAAASQSGLYFNPDGYRSFYVRSQCFQETAVRFRDRTLCAHVKERRSLMSSSWGISASQCQKLVAQAVAADRRTLDDLKRQYVNGHMTLRDFRIEPNGNGRDFDVLPDFAGETAGRYEIAIDILPSGHGAAPIRIHSSGYYIDRRANLRIFLKREDLQRQFPGFVAGRRYTVRATLSFTVPTGTGDARWSDAFVDSAFPARERSQSIARDIEFQGERRPQRQNAILSDAPCKSSAIARSTTSASSAPAPAAAWPPRS